MHSIETLRTLQNLAAATAYNLKQLQKHDQLSKGTLVEVVRGRKVPVGTKGKLLGWGDGQYGPWVRIEVNGEQVFVSQRNVRFPEIDAMLDSAHREAEQAGEQYASAIAAMRHTVGLDLSKPLSKGNLSQFAYSDSFVADYAVNPEASDELVRFMLGVLDPPQSSWGQLRWSGGSSLVERVSPDVVRVSSITCICD